LEGIREKTPLMAGFSLFYEVERTGIEPVTSGWQKRSVRARRTASLQRKTAAGGGNAANDRPQSTAVDRWRGQALGASVAQEDMVGWR
jgi:hypothetical protein